MKDILLALLLFAVLIAVGLLLLFRPEWLWKADFFLDVKGGAPSEWYLAKCRVIGALCLAVGIIGLVCMVLFPLAALLLSA